MSKEFLILHLQNMNAPTKENRNKLANIVLQKPKLITNLLSITFETNTDVSIKAAWVLEWICTHYQINILVPYLDEFTSKLQLLKLDSAIRPCAKICEHLAKAYTSKEKNEIKNNLNHKQIIKIIETGFDWLLTPQKTAVKAYTMTTLYLFGFQIDWVHPELKHIISTKIVKESKGCSARGKIILKLLSKI